MLEVSGKTSGKRAGPARIIHTMAKINPQEHSLGCIALLWPSPQSPPLPTSTLYGSLRKAASLMATCASRLVPFSCLRYPLLPRMRKRAIPVCGICCKVLQRLKPYVADMGSLLPQLPLSCQKGPGHGLPARPPTINVCERWTQIAVVHGSCSIKASGLLRQAQVILRRLHQGCSLL